eukprot:tig00001110_g7078.t1
MALEAVHANPLEAIDEDAVPRGGPRLTLEDVCSALDALVVSYFSAYDRALDCQSRLVKAISRGHWSLAKAKYSMGPRAITAVHYDNNMFASVRIRVECDCPHEEDWSQRRGEKTCISRAAGLSGADLERIDGEAGSVHHAMRRLGGAGLDTASSPDVVYDNQSDDAAVQEPGIGQLASGIRKSLSMGNGISSIRGSLAKAVGSLRMRRPGSSNSLREAGAAAACGSGAEEDERAAAYSASKGKQRRPQRSEGLELRDSRPRSGSSDSRLPVKPSDPPPHHRLNAGTLTEHAAKGKDSNEVTPLLAERILTNMESRALSHCDSELDEFDSSRPSPSRRDPLLWFGVLVSPHLRTAQQEFKGAVEIAVELADARHHMEADCRLYARLLATKAELLHEPLVDLS